MRILAPIVVCLLGACASQPAVHHPRPATNPALRGVIETANRLLTDAYNRGDKAAVARMYADDALMISDRGERYQGREAIDRYWNPPLKQGSSASPGKWILEVLSVEGTEAMPIQRGRSILEFQRGDKTSTSDVQFVVIWRKQQDNSYKVAVDAWWPTPK